jgi:hypothetical protein
MIMESAGGGWAGWVEEARKDDCFGGKRLAPGRRAS